MDRKTLSRLFSQYGNDVFRLALSYLGNRADAEDVCQTVFLKLASSNPILIPGKEKAWLLTCAANESRNLLKSFWRRNTGALDETLQFISKEASVLWEIVQRLPPRYRGVVHLYYYEGYDQAEIATILKISRSCVQTRLSRARDLLRKELKDDETTL